jgi:two-component system response regulator RegX3
MQTAPTTFTAGTGNSILLILQAVSFAQLLKRTFEANGYPITIVTTEQEAVNAAKMSPPALILMGRQPRTAMTLRGLPFLSRVPIVAVQDEPGPCTEEECLQDYSRDIDLVVCSQNPRELLARVRAILRRREPRAESGTYYSVGKINMDLDRHEVTVNGRLVELTPKEFQILRQFLESPNQLFSRQEMLNKVWGEGYALEEHALDVHIHSLRQKIEANPANPKAIITVRGIGYKLRG